MDIGNMNWEEFFQSHILSRGLEYFQNDKVKQIEIDKTAVKALVEGNGIYKVTIQFSGNSVETFSCTCPYAEKDCCKHMAAVLYALETFNNDTHNPEENNNHFAPVEEIPDFEDVVQKLTLDKAKIIISLLSGKNKEIQDRVVTLATGTFYQEYYDEILGKLETLTYRAQDSDGCIKGQYIDTYLASLEEYLDSEIVPLIKLGFPLDVFCITCSAFSVVVETGMIDYGKMNLFLDYCAVIWKKAVENADPQIKKVMFRTLKQLKKNSIEYFDDEDFDLIIRDLFNVKI